MTRMGQTPRKKGRAVGAAASLALSALTFAPGAALAQEGLQDGLIAFEDLPTSALLELYTDVGEVLKKRILVPQDWNPPQIYAEQLATKALELKTPKDGVAIGTDGARYRIVGLRVADETTPVKVTGLGAGDGFDELAVILFQQDYQIMAAAVFPSSVIAPKLQDGAVTLSKDVLTAQGVRSVTSKIYRFANESFQ